MALTRRQRQVYDFIDHFVEDNGYSPSFEEIGQGLGLHSLATVHKHVSNLEKKGLLKRDYNRSRSIDVLPPPIPTRAKAARLGSPVRGRMRQPAPDPQSVPLVGRIAAGRPVEAIETQQTISFADFARANEVFALEVRGNSMQDEHILDGDYVLVEKTPTARDGDIVVALCSGSDATLKRFYKEGDRIRLQPSNATMQPIILHAREVKIQGRVIGVLRKY